MLTPARIAAARFVVIRVRDAGSGATLHVNGTRIDLAGLRPNERVRFRARAGGEPGRLYRIRMTATDRAGNVREYVRAIRARNFGIVALAIRNLTRARRDTVRAAGGCGHVHLRPRHFRLGSAPSWPHRPDRLERPRAQAPALAVGRRDASAPRRPARLRAADPPGCLVDLARPLHTPLNGGRRC
jgi:hypothetical protein